MKTDLFIWVFFCFVVQVSLHATEEASHHRKKVVINKHFIQVDICKFSPEKYSLKVIDNINFWGMKRYERLAHAMKEGGYTAGVNGGFFIDENFTPKGLSICNGKRTGKFDANSWMKGVFFVERGTPKLVTRDEFADSDAISELLQSGPWLVQKQKALDNFGKDSRRAPRTFIGRGKDGYWAFGVIGASTLREAALILVSEDIKDVIDIVDALNLDGGPSTGFWMNKGKEVISLEEKWTVRNYIGLKKKETKQK